MNVPRGKPRGITGNISDHPHPSLSPQGRGWRKPRSKLRGIISLNLARLESSGTSIKQDSCPKNRYKNQGEEYANRCETQQCCMKFGSSGSFLSPPE